MASNKSRQFQDNIYEQLARVGKAVSSAKRIELLELLCQGPRSVELLADEAGLSVANASQHLRVLRAARLVSTERRGLFVEYRLAADDVSTFMVAMRTLAEARLVELEKVARDFFEERGSIEPVLSEELIRRVRSGEVTVLDVRPFDEYRAGHIPGAVSIPLQELKARLKELPKRREVIAYCRGPYCVMAVEAVTVLKAKGFAAHRMEVGVADWRARGWRVATQSSSENEGSR